MNTTTNIIMSHYNELVEQFNTLKTTPMFVRMQNTVEGSPWHREANVLVHTEMVTDEYINLVNDKKYKNIDAPETRWTRDDYLGGIACVFHDTGKPSAEKPMWSEARGNYRAYHGHELLSAHKFQDYAARNPDMFTADEIYKVMWFIEYHMPWNIEDKDKRRNMALTANKLGADTYTRALLADQYGRIADDQKTKNRNADQWVEDFMKLTREVETVDKGTPAHYAYMPIAPSGAGKSTYLRNLIKEKAAQGRTVEVFSLDLLRHEFYDATDYAVAFEKATKDKSFEAKANARFHEIVKRVFATEGADLYIDNTNLSAKRRKWYIDIVKKYDFRTVAVTMPVPLNVLLERQKTRGDKVVPDAAVKQQYRSLQLPSYGEFDDLIASNHNMVK